MVQQKRTKTRGVTQVTRDGMCIPKQEFVQGILEAMSIDGLAMETVAGKLGITKRALKRLLSGKAKLDIELMNRMAMAVGRNLHSVMR